MQHDHSSSLAAGAQMDCHAACFEVSDLKGSRKESSHAEKSNRAMNMTR